MTYEVAVLLPERGREFSVGDTVPISCEQTGWREVPATVVNVDGDTVTFLVDDDPGEPGPVLN